MGIYTSWASFALCHHLLVRLAGLRAKVRTRGKYLIIGDDIVIRDVRLASSYKGLLAAIDVPSNAQKSFVSTQDKSIAEFANKQFINGRELSPLPLRLLENDSSLKGEAAFLISCKEIGHQLQLNPVTYPENLNRFEILLISAYMFQRIRNSIPLSSAPENRLTEERLATILKE